MRHSMKALTEKNENLFEEVKVLKNAKIAAESIVNFSPDFDSPFTLADELERKDESYIELKNEFEEAKSTSDKLSL